MRPIWKAPLAVSGSLAFLAATWIVAAGPVQAHGYEVNSIEIVHPWMPEGPGPDAAVAMKIRNKAKSDDRIVAVRCKDAARARIVAPAPGTAAGAAGLDVPAGTEIELSASGPHVALEGLKRRRTPYDHFALTLVFKHAGPVAVEVMVEAASGD